MDWPLVASAEAEEELEWLVASRRRKAWAKCRGSWQASEAEDLSTEAATQDEDEDGDEDLPGEKLPAAAGRGLRARGRAGGRGVPAPWAPAASSGRSSRACRPRGEGTLATFKRARPARRLQCQQRRPGAISFPFRRTQACGLGCILPPVDFPPGECPG